MCNFGSNILPIFSFPPKPFILFLYPEFSCPSRRSAVNRYPPPGAIIPKSYSPDVVLSYSNMSNQSLLQYLSISLPAIPIQGSAPSRNTTNPRYGAEDITQVVDWPEFNYVMIIQRYGGILNLSERGRYSTD